MRVVLRMRTGSGVAIENSVPSGVGHSLAVHARGTRRCDAELVGRFLDFVETSRGNSARSRNIRLAANPVSLDTIVAAGDLDPGYTPGAAPVEALRRCTWLGAVLHLPYTRGIVLDNVLRQHQRLIGPPPSSLPPARPGPMH